MVIRTKSYLRWSLYLVVFLATILLAIGASYYKQSVAGERVYFQVLLPQQHAQTVRVDLVRQGWPKYLVQPGRLILGSGQNGIKNTSSRPIRLLVKPLSFPENIQMKSFTHTLDKREDGYLVTLEPHQALSLTIELNIERAKTRESDMGTVMLQFVDDTSQQLLGQVFFALINSR